MLDEPLGALDRALRERLVAELRALFVRLGLTILFVTHDQDEAFALADRVVVMHAGRIEQVGTPAEVWQQPANAFVARFLGWNVTRGVRRRARAVRPEALRSGRRPAAHVAVAGRHRRTFRRDHFLLAVRVDALDADPSRCRSKCRSTRRGFPTSATASCARRRTPRTSSRFD